MERIQTIPLDGHGGLWLLGRNPWKHDYKSVPSWRSCSTRAQHPRANGACTLALKPTGIVNQNRGTSGPTKWWFVTARKDYERNPGDW